MKVTEDFVRARLKSEASRAPAPDNVLDRVMRAFELEGHVSERAKRGRSIRTRLGAAVAAGSAAAAVAGILLVVSSLSSESGDPDVADRSTASSPPTTGPSESSSEAPTLSRAGLAEATRVLLAKSRSGSLPPIAVVGNRVDSTGLEVGVPPEIEEEYGRAALTTLFEQACGVPVTVEISEMPQPLS